MFPRDFEHDGELQLLEMPTETWYEEYVAPKKRSMIAFSPTYLVTSPESWASGPLYFSVTAAKQILLKRPRLPAFVSVDTFDDDIVCSEYLKTIYADREDEWPWVRLEVPAIIGRYHGRRLLLDGNHRYAKARRLGREHFLAYLLTEDETERISSVSF